MPRTKLTDSAIRALAAPVTGVVWDTPRFGLRLAAGGTRSWVIKYAHHGRARWLTLGTFPLVSLADARALAKVKLGQVVQGIDPSAEGRAARDATTFGALVAEYLRVHAPRKRTGKEDARILAKYPPKSWTNTPAATITRRQVRDLLEALAVRAPVQANRVLSCLHKVYNFGIGRELVEMNPCAMVERPGAEHARERTFTAAELRALLAAFEADDEGPTFKLMLLLGARGGEVRSLRETDVDLETGVWTLPADQSKTKKSRRIPLSALALHTLRAYGVPQRTVQDFRGSIRKAHARIMVASAVTDWRPHDLRAACGTGLALLGYSTDLIAAVLGHVVPGTTAKHYIRMTRENDVRGALDAWARRLEQIVSGKEPAKVVSLRA